MNAVLDLVERLPTRVLWLTAAGVVLVCLGAAWALGGTMLWMIGVFGLFLVFAVVAVLAVRAWIEGLPLEMAPLAVRGRLDGHGSYAFRVRLGRGRRMDHVRARVRFLPNHGEPFELTPLIPDTAGVVGPFTVVVVDRSGRCGADGAFEIWVEAKDRGRTWSATRRYDRGHIQTGRYRAGLVREGVRFRWDRERWHEVESETGEAA